MQDAFGYDPKYVMGRSTAETDRLKRHSQLYDASTWQLFKEEGPRRRKRHGSIREASTPGGPEQTSNH